jgi:hypothetical protein
MFRIMEHTLMLVPMPLVGVIDSRIRFRNNIRHGFRNVFLKSIIVAVQNVMVRLNNHNITTGSDDMPGSTWIIRNKVPL